MQKSEDVVIPMNKNDIRYYVGNDKVEIKPLPVYSWLVCEFLDDLSRMLRNDSQAKRFPDIMTFAFWCRKGNINKLKENYQGPFQRVGRGLVFHVAPSNVPINFAFSLVFGMLAGNANIVRVSEKDFAQTEIVCRAIRSLFEKTEYEILAKQTQVVSYGHIKEINDMFSAMCDVRIIWGGDAAISQIRQSPMKARATEVTFADRYSFAMFDEEQISKLSEDEQRQLAQKFYNDTYLMDQNACSSPHLVIWKNAMQNKSGRKQFWNFLYEAASNYDLPEKKVIDKYTYLCENIARYTQIQSVIAYDNLLYVVQINSFPERIDELRGMFGVFYEMDYCNDGQLFEKLTEKVQTCVTYGIDKNELLKELIEHHAAGIDRIVDAGEAMDIGVYWDGYDVIGNLSRAITVTKI